MAVKIGPMVTGRDFKIEELDVSVEMRPLDELPADLVPALNYWRSITPRGRVGPRWGDFDLMRLTLSYLPTAVVVDYDARDRTFRYRFWGSRLTPVFGKDLTGKTFDDAPGVFPRLAHKTYSLVVEQMAPCLIRFWVTSDGKTSPFQTAFRMPLSEDGDTVSGVVSLLLLEYKKHLWERHLHR